MRHTEKEQAVISGLNNVSNLTVSDDTKLIDIIVSSLYSEPVGSFVRELISNAVDSHKEAGKESLPFDVTLPTKFNPSFIVQDFGVGMSPETVDKIYNVIGASTKENSNEALGRWGLGSKTPLAYTSQFVIESVYNGTKTTYSIFKNEFGIGTAVLESTDTIETNGVKVIVPVKPDDFNLVENELHSQLKFLHKPFNLNGKRYEYDMQTRPEEWKQLTDSMYVLASQVNSVQYHQNEISIVQGGVTYNVDKSKIVQYLAHAELEELHNFVNVIFSHTSKLVMFFDIGEINVPPSRESIIFDDVTVQNISKKLSVYYTQIESKIDSIYESEIHIRDKVQKFIDDPVLHSYCEPLGKDKLDWGFNAKTLAFLSCTNNKDENGELTLTYAMHYRVENDKVKKYDNRHYEYNTLLSPKTKVLIRDTDFRPFVRMKELAQQGYTDFMVVDCSDDDVLIDNSKKFIEDRMLGVDYTLMSDISLPKAENRNKGNSVPTKCRVAPLYSVGNRYSFKYAQAETLLPKDGTGIAICCSYYEPDEHDKQPHDDVVTFLKMVNFFKTISNCNVNMSMNVYALNATNYERFIKGDNIITLKQFIENYKSVYEQELTKYQDIAKTLSRFTSFVNYLERECYEFATMVQNVDFYPRIVNSMPKSDFRSLVTRYNTLRMNDYDIRRDLNGHERRLVNSLMVSDCDLVTDKEKQHVEALKKTLVYKAIATNVLKYQYCSDDTFFKTLIPLLEATT